jgi:ankyrin repeat protein
MAASFGKLLIISCTIGVQGARIAVDAHDGSTAMETAVADVEQIDESTGISAMVADVEQVSMICQLAKDGATPIAKRMLARNPAELEARCWFGASPLHVAATYGRTGMVKFLISKGARLSATDSYGDQPLHAAVANAKDDCVKALVQAGADVDAKNDQGDTPRAICAKFKRLEVMGMGSVLEGKSYIGIDKILNSAGAAAPTTTPTTTSAPEDEWSWDNLNDNNWDEDNGMAWDDFDGWD